jgi:hypothetical protein
MLKLKRYDAGVWYSYEACPGVRFKIRPLPASRMQEFWSSARDKQISSVKPDGTVEMIFSHNNSVMEWRAFVHVLEEWEGIEIEGGAKDTPREAFVRAIYDDPDVRWFIIQTALKAAMGEDKALDAEKKTSETSPGG